MCLFTGPSGRRRGVRSCCIVVLFLLSQQLFFYLLCCQFPVIAHLNDKKKEKLARLGVYPGGFGCLITSTEGVNNTVVCERLRLDEIKRYGEGLK